MVGLAHARSAAVSQPDEPVIKARAVETQQVGLDR